MWSGFQPDDFFVFEDPDTVFRVGYIKEELHPRLRELGKQISKAFLRNRAIELRSQLRSGRWFRWPYWTNVSLISPEETNRGDGKRPRLSIYIDDKRVITGFCHSIWSKGWKIACKDERELAKVIDSTAKASKLQIGIMHWTEWGETEKPNSEISTFTKANMAIKKATQIGQDFLFVGRYYPWPDEKNILCSESFIESAQQVLFSAWPIYEYVFNIKMENEVWS